MSQGPSLHRYRYSSFLVASEIELPLPVEPCGRALPELTIRRCPSIGPRDYPWDSSRPVLVADVGTEGLEVRVTEDGYLLRFGGVVLMALITRCRELQVLPTPGADPDTLEHFLLDQALPRALAHMGHLMVHASAVSVGGRALCLVAPSGTGKSTLAAMLVAAGCRLLSDDVVRLQAGSAGVTVHAAYPSLRLWSDSAPVLSPDRIETHMPMADYTSKRVYRLKDVPESQTGTPLGAILTLSAWTPGSGVGVRLNRLSPAEACMSLVGQTFWLHPGTPELERRRLRQVAEVCGRSLVRELAFEHDYALGEAVLAVAMGALEPR